MRRSLPTLVVAATLTAALAAGLPAGPATAGAADPGRPGPDPTAAPAAVLERAVDTLAGRTLSPSGRAASPTLALADLLVALPRLGATDRAAARAALARPTDGIGDAQGDGYTVPSRRTCSKRICVHWVNRTDDAPRSRTWVTRTMRVMKRVWAKEVGTLGYRRPIADGRRGGDDRFDVYLADVGADGYYGYCAPERRVEGWQWRASGYCVLDDDFARSQFGAKPLDSLRVTAAHEFFHAVQFAYDYAEDRWFMESTATWMEERVADAVDDNRQYLRHGQLARPGTPLDLFDPAGFAQYGNWAFFEYLSTRFGNRTVRRAWEIAADVRDRDSDPYSIRAVRLALPTSRTLTDVLRAYAAANTTPAKSYPEGARWPSADPATSHVLGPRARSAEGSQTVDHLASRSVAARPGDGLDGAWRLRVVVDGPAGRTSPAAMLVVRRTDGSVERLPVGLDADGVGRRTVPFGVRVTQVRVVLVNASTRFRCWREDETYSCQGVPRDDDRAFAYRLRALAP